MKIAREIVEQLVRTPTHLDGSGCACITDSAGNIHVPPKLLESIIAAKLKPVRDALDAVTPAITSTPHDSSVDHRDAWVYGILLGWSGDALDEVLDKHGWRGTRLETDLAKHRAALAMLSDDE